jgi:hypothetical protein
MVVSDHVPLLLHYKGRPIVTRVPRFESFWLRYEETAHIVQQLWSSTYNCTASNLSNTTVIQEKIDKTHALLATWHKDKFSRMDTQLVVCKEAILFFNCIEEKRALTTSKLELN